MARPTKLNDLIVKAQKDTGWNFANSVLYDLCKKYPKHDDPQKIVAKVWLIGRSYAAAIERGRTSGGPSEDFYVDSVGPKLKKSSIDKLISKVNGKIPSEKSLQLLIDVHEELTQIFHVISGRRNRSLASKYLHFHVPKFFFIYDSRARVGIGALNDLFDEAPKKYKGGDGEYRCFVEKCLKVQTQLKEEYKVELNPRQLDNLLLAVENTAKVVR